MIDTSIVNTMDLFMYFMIGFSLLALAGVLWSFKWGDRN
ncbi:MAG: hypothetical protein KatS3mg061_3349 [Dehalococcoidia bacterium]|nr:MAG: hypothetical protein KatS3mg061_3349 [Dehalococcoidia bacterium]